MKSSLQTVCTPALGDQAQQCSGSSEPSVAALWPIEYDILLFLTATTASRYKIGGLILEVSDGVASNIPTNVASKLLIFLVDWSSRKNLDSMLNNWASDVRPSFLPIHPSFIHVYSHRPPLL